MDTDAVIIERDLPREVGEWLVSCIGGSDVEYEAVVSLRNFDLKMKGRRVFL